jgi:hypothetical protein
VIDLAPHLYGLTLPLREVTSKKWVGRVCVVELGAGMERLIPVAATDLGSVREQPSPCRLSVAAVSGLLAAAAALPRVRQEDAAGYPDRPRTPAAREPAAALGPARASPTQSRSRRSRSGRR